MKNNIGGIVAPGNSKKNMTGDWRYYKPVVNSNCVKCGICELYCPDSCIIMDGNKDTIEINYDYCKGCGICSSECPKNAIVMEQERK